MMLHICELYNHKFDDDESTHKDMVLEKSNQIWISIKNNKTLPYLKFKS